MHDSYIRAASLHEEKEAVLHIGLLNTARPERYFWNLEDRFKKEYPGIQLELSSEYMTDLETSCWKESTMQSWCRILNGLHWNERNSAGNGQPVPTHRLLCQKTIHWRKRAV